MIPKDKLEHIKSEVRHLLNTYEVSSHPQIKSYMRKLINDELLKSGLKLLERRETIKTLTNDLWLEIKEKQYENNM